MQWTPETSSSSTFSGKFFWSWRDNSVWLYSILFFNCWLCFFCSFVACVSTKAGSGKTTVFHNLIFTRHCWSDDKIGWFLGWNVCCMNSQTIRHSSISICTVDNDTLHYSTLHCIALHWKCTANALHCTALHCISLHCTALHWIALQMHCIALHLVGLQ